jgi:hypothetical protein
MLSGIRRAGAVHVETRITHIPRQNTSLGKFKNSFFSKSWPLPSKYCIAIAFRIAASRSHSQCDVPAIGPTSSESC